MPGRNVVKAYYEGDYYHDYNRGVNKRIIFINDEYYVFYLSLLKRYLSKTAPKSIRNIKYDNYTERIDLLAFCLMPNHFHLLLYQHDYIKAMETLTSSVLTTYTMYFNRRYKRVGHLFQGAYKASQIVNEPYILHISRYIHMNPDDHKSWPYSN